MEDYLMRLCVRIARLRLFASGVVLVAFGSFFCGMPTTDGAEAAPAGTSVSYSNDKAADVPWSIHVVKVSHQNSDYELHSWPGKGRTIGLSTLSTQIKTLPHELGHPVAAINADFWNERRYAGDPMGLQISQGELISAPCERVCFWIDTNGYPRMGTVLGLFQATWPGGQQTAIGLNSELTNNAAILYTPAIGPSTRTKKSRELILEPNDDGPWLPLGAGQTYSARVREVRENGNTPVTPGTMVLALSPPVAARMPPVAAGAVLKISTMTTPDLSQVQTAVGGGPALVRNGQPTQWSGHQTRHPRTAIGWNATHLYLVQVDGRQRGLSVGMTFPELTDYMVKLGCDEAMNFDGGGSSTAWVFGRIVNSPCYGHEREMANSLILVFKDKEITADPD